MLRERSLPDGDTVLELRANGIFVMDTQETSTERALATLALEQVASPERVLVGGLGLGFTLAAVLADPRVAWCGVAEIEPTLVDWLREDVVPGGAALLADPRVAVLMGDVADTIAAAPAAAYDLVLLDVDNGPRHLVHQTNAGLYATPALRTLRSRIAPGGAVVVWSADEAPEFEHALAEVFPTALASPWEVTLQGREEQYWLYVGRRPA